VRAPKRHCVRAICDGRTAFKPLILFNVTPAIPHPHLIDIFSTFIYLSSAGLSAAPQQRKNHDENRTASPSASKRSLVLHRPHAGSRQSRIPDLRHVWPSGRVLQILALGVRMISLQKRFTAIAVFSGSENRRWWRIFLRRGWRHVYLIIPAYYPAPSLTADVYSQVINMWTDHVRCDVVWKSPRSLAETALTEGATCAILLPVDQKFTGRYLPRGLFTCVSMIKAMLSIGAWYVWTPEQLARWMLQNGGELLEKPNDIPFQQAESRHESAGCTDAGAAFAGAADPAADGRADH